MNFTKRKKATYTAYVAVMFLLCLVSLYGCSLFVKQPQKVAPLPERSGVLQKDLLKRALFFSSIKLSGRLKLKAKGKEFPSVRINAWLLSMGSSSYLRIKGFTAFGITLFDLLAKGEQAWVYLPRSKRVYEGSRFFTSYGSIDVKSAIRAMEMVLNPWSPVRYTTLKEVQCQEEQPEGLTCLKGGFLGRPFIFKYSLSDLSPITFYSSDMELFFSGKFPKVPVFSKEITFFLYKAETVGKLTLSNIQCIALSPESQLFDDSYFLGKKGQ